MNNLNLTENKGLSLSQASSISNLCNQSAMDIESELNSINNSSTEIEYNGKTLVQEQKNQLPNNVVELLLEKGKLHACQAFLMENINRKERLLQQIKNEQFVPTYEVPESVEFDDPELKRTVDETWGWEQLSKDEYNEFLENEAMASHIGKFIHKNGKLDSLRKELPNLKGLEWIELEQGKKTPVTRKIHHTKTELLDVHNKLANLHREYESKVNYFKAKVKNLVTMENAKISEYNKNEQERVNKLNLEKQQEWEVKYNVWLSKKQLDTKNFETERYNKIQKVASMRIEVDPRFQTIIDKFLTKE